MLRILALSLVLSIVSNASCRRRSEPSSSVNASESSPFTVTILNSVSPELIDKVVGIQKKHLRSWDPKLILKAASADTSKAGTNKPKVQMLSVNRGDQLVAYALFQEINDTTNTHKGPKGTQIPTQYILLSDIAYDDDAIGNDLNEIRENLIDGMNMISGISDDSGVGRPIAAPFPGYHLYHNEILEELGFFPLQKIGDSVVSADIDSTGTPNFRDTKYFIQNPPPTISRDQFAASVVSGLPTLTWLQERLVKEPVDTGRALILSKFGDLRHYYKMYPSAIPPKDYIDSVLLEKLMPYLTGFGKSVVITGPAGSGKSAALDALFALLATKGFSPEENEQIFSALGDNVFIVTLTASKLMSDTQYRGQMEAILKALFDDTQRKVVLKIDEIGVFASELPKVFASMLTALADNRCIFFGAATTIEWNNSRFITEAADRARVDTVETKAMPREKVIEIILNKAKKRISRGRFRNYKGSMEELAEYIVDFSSVLSPNQGIPRGPILLFEQVASFFSVNQAKYPTLGLKEVESYLRNHFSLSPEAVVSIIGQDPDIEKISKRTLPPGVVDEEFNKGLRLAIGSINDNHIRGSNVFSLVGEKDNVASLTEGIAKGLGRPLQTLDLRRLTPMTLVERLNLLAVFSESAFPLSVVLVEGIEGCTPDVADLLIDAISKRRVEFTSPRSGNINEVFFPDLFFVISTTSPYVHRDLRIKAVSAPKRTNDFVMSDLRSKYDNIFNSREFSGISSSMDEKAKDELFEKVVQTIKVESVDPAKVDPDSLELITLNVMRKELKAGKGTAQVCELLKVLVEALPRLSAEAKE